MLDICDYIIKELKKLHPGGEYSLDYRETEKCEIIAGVIWIRHGPVKLQFRVDIVMVDDTAYAYLSSMQNFPKYWSKIERYELCDPDSLDRILSEICRLFRKAKNNAGVDDRFEGSINQWTETEILK